jgi:hypothetical protein
MPCFFARSRLKGRSICDARRIAGILECPCASRPCLGPCGLVGGKVVPAPFFRLNLIYSLEWRRPKNAIPNLSSQKYITKDFSRKKISIGIIKGCTFL